MFVLVLCWRDQTQCSDADVRRQNEPIVSKRQQAKVLKFLSSVTAVMDTTDRLLLRDSFLLASALADECNLIAPQSPAHRDETRRRV